MQCKFLIFFVTSRGHFTSSHRHVVTSHRHITSSCHVIMSRRHIHVVTSQRHITASRHGFTLRLNVTASHHAVTSRGHVTSWRQVMASEKLIDSTQQLTILTFDLCSCSDSEVTKLQNCNHTIPSPVTYQVRAPISVTFFRVSTQTDRHVLVTAKSKCVGRLS